MSKAYLKVKMLDSLTESYNELVSHSKYKGTLLETQRKQNLSQGLTNISDPAFELICFIDEKMLSVQNEKAFNLHGSDFFSYCHATLLEDASLYNDCWNLF